MDIANQLRKFDLFSEASQAEMNDLVLGCNIKAIKPNTIILYEGDTTNNVFLAIKGHLQVYMSNQKGKEIIIKDLYEGDIFGELGVLCNSRRCANIISKSETTLIALDGNCYKNYYQNNFHAAKSVINILANSLSKITRDYESLALDDLYHRLIHVLLEVSVKEEDGLIVRYTHNEIANRVASSRESVSRAISDMKKKQLVESVGNYLRLTDELLDLYSQL